MRSKNISWFNWSLEMFEEFRSKFLKGEPDSWDGPISKKVMRKKVETIVNNLPETEDWWTDEKVEVPKRWIADLLLFLVEGAEGRIVAVNFEEDGTPIPLYED